MLIATSREKFRLTSPPDYPSLEDDLPHVQQSKVYYYYVLHQCDDISLMLIQQAPSAWSVPTVKETIDRILVDQVRISYRTLPQALSFT